MKDEYIQFSLSYRSIVITNAAGLEFNVTPNVGELNIYEDLFSNTLSGNIVVADDLALVDRMDLRGNEKIKVEMHKEHEDSTVEIFDFFVYSTNSRQRINNTSEAYVINFVSFEAILNNNTRCYQAIEGTNDAGVKELFDMIGTEKSIDIESTSGHHKFVMPSWTPFEGINWYAGRSISADSGGSYFLFYETLKGFKFKSVEALIKSNPVYEYRHEPAGTDFLVKDATNIREFKVVEMGDSISGTSEYYTTLWTHDLIRKKVVKQDFSYDKDNKGKLNEHLLGTTSKTGFNIDLAERREVFGSKVVTKLETRNVHMQTSDYVYDAIQPKMSAMRQFSNLKIRFLAFGNRKMNVGDVVEMKFLRSMMITKENKNEDDAEDKLLSGKYIISAIRFMFKPHSFHMVVEAIKDTRKS